MELGLVTKLDKWNKTISKKIDDGVISENWVAIVNFPIFAKFGAIQKIDSRRIYKSYIFINSNLWKFFNTALTLLLLVKVLFLPKKC